MKISVGHIISDHLATLRNARTQWPSLSDLFVFFIIPSIVSSAVWWDSARFSNETYNMAVSILSIFGALLFSAQVAMFSVLQRDDRTRQGSIDTKRIGLIESRLNERKGLLREVNANLSYAILTAATCLIFVLVTSVVNVFPVARAVASTFFALHFLLTILLIIARVHTLFQKEYEA